MVSLDTIKKCRQGDRRAHKSMYELTAPYVFTIVKSYINDEDKRKDIMQEIYAAVFNGIHSFDEGKGIFKTWIATISVRKCIDSLRVNNRLEFNTELEAITNLGEEQFRHLDHLTKADIEDLLQNMPIGYKTVFMLSIIDEYSHQEISDMLQISQETSRTQLHRAIKWIKKKLDHQLNNIVRHEAL